MQVSHHFVIMTSSLRNPMCNQILLDKYIQFRIKKTAQVPFRCHICNFCFPDEKSYNRHINKKTCEKNLKLFEEYTQSLENDDDDDNSDADEVNIFFKASEFTYCGLDQPSRKLSHVFSECLNQTLPYQSPLDPINQNSPI